MKYQITVNVTNIDLIKRPTINIQIKPYVKIENPNIKYMSLSDPVHSQK
jgi:hypothetical protein